MADPYTSTNPGGSTVPTGGSTTSGTAPTGGSTAYPSGTTSGTASGTTGTTSGTTGGSAYGGTGGGSTSGGSTSGTADTAREQAQHLKESATEAGGQLLGEAKEEARAVGQEARRQLGDLWSQARGEVSDQAGTQQRRLAGGLSTTGQQLTQMASSSQEQSFATDLVRAVGERVGDVGQWLESRGPDELIDEVRRFARRRPGTFLLVAAGAGIVLGRLTRGLKDASSDDTSGSTSRASGTYPARVSTRPEPLPPVYELPAVVTPPTTATTTTTASPLTGELR